MREIEQQIIDVLTQKSPISIGAFKKLIKQFSEQPFGLVTEEFLNDKIVKKYQKGELKLGKHLAEPMDSLKLRLLVEEYLIPSDKKKKGECLAKIRLRVEDIRKEISKPNGQGLLPSDANRELIKNIYLSKNEQLIDLFSTTLPIPGIEVFEGHSVPSFIAERTKQATQAVLNFFDFRIARFSEKLPSLTSAEGVIEEVVNIQRKFRAKRRRREEVIRISNYDSIRGDKKSEREKEEAIKERKIAAEQMLAQASRAYSPKECPEDLAQAIVEAASQISLFSTVSHWTSESSLTDMFNDCIYGRKTLLQMYRKFVPSTLEECDLDQGGGDANVICFAIQRVDPRAKAKEDAVELVFEVAKLKGNPCVFFKQRDLGYGDEETIRKLEFSDDQICFSHTKSLPEGVLGCTNFQWLQASPKKRGRESERDVYRRIAFSELPNYNFIAYNFDKMHQILVLNGFRFLDALCESDGGKPDKQATKHLYQLFKNEKDNKKLSESLRTFGQLMTDTAEFNFYGAYQIDFSALQSIFSKKADYTLNLPEFIKKLEEGDLKKLKEAVEKIPSIFKSHRFLDYLLSKVEKLDIRKELLQWRQASVSTQPLWMGAWQEIQSRRPSLTQQASQDKSQDLIHSTAAQLGQRSLISESVMKSGGSSVSPLLFSASTSTSSSSVGGKSTVSGSKKARKKVKKKGKKPKATVE